MTIETKKLDEDISYIHEDGAWKKISNEALCGMTIGDLLNGGKRIVWMVTLKYGKKVYLSITESDRDALRKKHPNAPVICLAQLAGLFSGNLSADRLKESFIDFLTFIHMAPGNLKDTAIGDVKE